MFRTFHGSSKGKETRESVTSPEGNVPMSCSWKDNYSYWEVCENQRRSDKTFKKIVVIVSEIDFFI